MCIDSSLLTQAQAFLRLGEQERASDSTLKMAWDKFFEIERKHLYRLVSKRCLCHELRQDVMQDVWIEMVKQLHKFQGDEAVQRLHGWMRRVVNSKVVNAIRRLARRRTVKIDAEMEESLDTESAEGARMREYREWLAVKLAEVPTSYRLMVGHFLDGRAIVDLAAELGMTPEAARCRIHRAIVLLRQSLLELIDKS